MSTSTTRPQKSDRSAGAQKAETLKLALAIPTLCEAENIGGLIVHIRTVLETAKINWEIIVVDDDSSDGTGGVVSADAAQDPRVPAPHRPQGPARPLRRRPRRLSPTPMPEVLGVMDADLLRPPEGRLFAAAISRPSVKATTWPSACRYAWRRSGRVEPDAEAPLCRGRLGNTGPFGAARSAPRTRCRASS